MVRLVGIGAFVLCLFMSVCTGVEYSFTPAIGKKGVPCYDEFDRPQRCIPEFENSAFEVDMEATNTCGDRGPVPYCVQTGIEGIRKLCDVCYPNQHSAQFLTDFHREDNLTWWQSDTMMEGVPQQQINLTLNLRKAFDITYIRILFYSPRPESFAVYKRTKEDAPWIPYQFFSATCRDTYGLPESLHAQRGEETRALCNSEYSEISPLKNGNVAFSTLEGRPSAYNFDTSPELQEFVTATDIRIVLDRLNTFGDEVFGDPQVLRSYFYAIADVAVGARCKCNGHASECRESSAEDGSRRRVCKCEHNTAGPDCNECLPFYNDAPWQRASERDAHVCKQCNCNNFSNRCYFDQKLYEQTGHGGHCLDCTANRDGPNCERCRENYYQREDGYCVACNCDATGSRSLQCNTEGKCQCKPGVTGDKCNRCEVNYYEFSTSGCKECGCSESGSFQNTPNCDPYHGTCHCKENVEGKRCRECKPGFFNLDIDNEFGCTPCFCFGHSSQCTSAVGYSKSQTESAFVKSTEKWRAEDFHGRPIEVQFNALSHSIGVSALGHESVYFLAPERYLGQQRSSYNQLLKFALRIGENGPVATAMDIILEGAGASVTNTIFAQKNQIPSIQKQHYQFRLHEHPDYGWQPRLSARAFMSILSNLTAIKIRATYTPQGVGFLDDVQLDTAHRGVTGSPATWVEQCKCPTGYVGQHCESCAPGYRHSPSLGGPFMPCIPCDCNKHAEICDSETGRCICQHHTSGDNCEICARGYYGDALAGTPEDCKPCGCPDGGACIQIDDDVMCIECPLGYTGQRCDSCSDGYFGDPTGRSGPTRPCQVCECNLNIDTNAIGNCNTTTGECLKCIHNTGGLRCEHCLPGFFGDALSLPKGDCQQCECYSVGTEEGSDGISVCDQITGTCRCKTHVQGRNCDQCEEGYYNILSRDGCQSCNCNSIGSVNNTCDLYSGQCNCRPGITGLRCDQCEPYKYGFSSEGCKSCNCDPIGSKGLQCDSFGQCPCNENVEGRQCDRCKENKHDKKRGCINCPDCYNLVQDAAHQHLDKLNHLRTILDEIEQNPTVIDDETFEEQLKVVQQDVQDLSDAAKVGMGSDEKTILEKLDEIRDRQKEVNRTLSEIEENIQLAGQNVAQGHVNITHASHVLKDAESKLNDAIDSVDTGGRIALDKARQKAKEFGQQSEKMTQIAQEARELADELDITADDIVEEAHEAKNRSIEAYEMAKNVTSKQKNITQEIRTLRSDLYSTELKLERIAKATDEAYVKATDIKNKAVTLLNTVKNLEIPSVNATELKIKTEETKKEAQQILDDANKLFEEKQTELREIREEILNAEDLLERGTDQKFDIDEMISEVDFAKIQAENAVELGDKTLNDAQATYKVLKHFDQQVQESKVAAQQALEKIPEIRQIINDAIDKTKIAESSLAGARTNAQDALSKAETANELAKNASKNAELISQEAVQLNQNATKVKNEAELMADRVKNTAIEFNNLLRETDNNASLINEAKDKVGRAGKDSQEVTKKVNEILKDVEGIVRELESIPNFDDSELDRLETELKNAEQKIQEANLDEILERLQKEQREQNLMYDEYSAEIARLKKEVENVEQIANALPQGCFRKPELEP